MPLGIHPTIDFVFKMICGRMVNADVLIDLLNAVLQWDVPIVSVQIVNPFNLKRVRKGKYSVVDIKARDALGRSFVIEMQTTLPAGLRNRWVYYTSGLYFEQLQEGGGYADLGSAICISFLSQTMFPETTAAHLRFTLHDKEHGIDLGDQLQIHVVELPKFALDERTISRASALEQWVFFLFRAADYNARTLRRLLPRPALHKAIGVLEMISRRPEFRVLYDDEAKAELDRFSEEKARKRVDEAFQQMKDESARIKDEMSRTKDEMSRTKDELSRLKEARARAEKEAAAARTVGREEGQLIGRILTLQEFLDETPSDESMLSHLELSELKKMAQKLERRWKAGRR